MININDIDTDKLKDIIDSEIQYYSKIVIDSESHILEVLNIEDTPKLLQHSIKNIIAYLETLND